MDPTVVVNLRPSDTRNFGMARSGEDLRSENLYKVEERPPFLFSFLNATQILITQTLSVLWLPLLLTPALCTLPADPVRVYLVSTALLTSGVVTSLQSTLGIRLPTVAAPSALYTASLLSLLHGPSLQCRSEGDLYAMGSALRAVEWQTRLREVQGAILFAGLCQAVLGFSGLQAFLCRVLSPVSVAPAVILAGLTTLREPLAHLAGHWGLFSLVAALMVLFALGLRNISLPLPPTFSMRSGWTAKCFHVFQLFPVLWTCVAVWVICKTVSMFTSTTAYPDEQVIGFQEAVDNSKWFFFSFPFEWGLPTLSAATVLHLLPAIVLQSATSLFMFHANANTCGLSAPPCSAVRRGLGVEGLGLVLGSLWGHSIVTNTSNVGLISFSKLVSRTSTQLAALLMISISHFTRLTAVLADIPVHFLSALQVCLHAGVVSIGISMLRSTSVRHRDTSIVGLSLLLGLVVPQWVTDPSFTVDTGSKALDLLLSQGLSSSMFVGASVGCLLDLSLPGRVACKTHSWKLQSEEDKKTYRLPTWEELLCSALEQSPFFSPS